MWRKRLAVVFSTIPNQPAEKYIPLSGLGSLRYVLSNKMDRHGVRNYQVLTWPQ